ncbi:unnamed protein product [Owenia fusiformis]|uniref:Alpha-mannosidase n=1 Tax=Owenia fusiformis TaxID=6347 RepID=A0A8J1Y1L5_OWEFU|nr:unnamed protein product [Owenia fusiformis]
MKLALRLTLAIVISTSSLIYILIYISNKSTTKQRVLTHLVHRIDKTRERAKYETLRESMPKKDEGQAAGTDANNGALPLPKADADVYTQDVFDYVNENYSERYDTLPNDMHKLETRKDRLNVFIIPHSHVDPGWLQTVDEYYTESVHDILTNAVLALTDHPKMKFMWAETVFLKKWWDALTFNNMDDVKVKFRKLLKDKRFEIVMGSWVMPDEASTHYYSIIDQMVEGHQWLEHNLGVKPQYTWSIDPFGHSSAFPFFLKAAGFRGMAISRIHSGVKRKLALDKSLEFHWRQTWDQMGQHDLFCHVLAGSTYVTGDSCGIDPKVCQEFDFSAGGTPWGQNPIQITNSTIAEQADILYRQYMLKSDLFRTRNIFNLVGHDFRYRKMENYEDVFRNFQRLIEYMNNNETMNVHIEFGTLGDYFNKVDDDLEQTKMPHLIGDFFPYVMSTRPSQNDYWTGYFTTRPFDKYLGRELQSMVRTAEILNTFSALRIKQLSAPHDDHEAHVIGSLRALAIAHEELGVYQHHDAITGTEVRHVAKDYEKRMMKGLQSCYNVIRKSFAILNPETNGIAFDLDNVRDEDDMQIAKAIIGITKERRVTVFNPIAKRVQTVARFLIIHPNVDVYDINGYKVDAQINPVWRDNAVFIDRYELIFGVTVPAFGTSTYTLKEKNGAVKFAEILTSDVESKVFTVKPLGKNDIHVMNSFMEAKFSAINGDLLGVKQEGDNHKIHTSFVSYHSGQGGAYVFKPRGKSDQKLFSSQKPIVRVIKGEIVTEVHTLYDGLSRVAIIHHTGEDIQRAITIHNSIDIRHFPEKDRRNIEVMMEIKSNVSNKDGLFYSDANGLQMSERKNNPKIAVNGNFYPMTSMVYLESQRTRLTISSAQPLGVANLKSGELQIGLDRMTTADDGKGMNQAVDDNKVTLSRFMIYVEKRRSPHDQRTVSTPSAVAISLQNILNNPLVQFIYEDDSGSNSEFKDFSLIQTPLPCHINVVSIRGLFNKSSNHSTVSDIGLTLHAQGYDNNIGNKSSTICKQYSNKFNMENIFGKTAKLSTIKETTLSFMHIKRDISVNDNLDIRPMELKSFKIALE